MLIDWFTVGAQVINFLVLIYLLKRFLYGPIIRAMDAREKRIALRLEEGRKKKDEAQQEFERYQEKNREIDVRREALLSQIREEAEARRKELIDEARSQVDVIRANWYEAIQREKEAFLQNLRRQTGKHTYEIARRALKDLANVDLEHHIVQVFIERLRNLTGEERDALEQAIRRSGTKVSVQSAFQIPQEMLQEIMEVLQNLGSDTVDLQFKLSSDLICGIELKVHGRKVAWSLEEYLENLEDGWLEGLDGGTNGSK